MDMWVAMGQQAAREAPAGVGWWYALLAGAVAVALTLFMRPLWTKRRPRRGTSVNPPGGREP